MGTAKAKQNVVVNSAKLDAKTPIPIEETNGRSFLMIQKGRKYVPFFDKGDDFFSTLLTAGLLSPTNFGCVNSKTKYSIGRGLMLLDGAKNEAFNKWIKVVNKRGESLNEVLKQVFNNYYSSGNCFIELVRFSVGKNKYFKVFVRNYIDCRLVMPDPDDDDNDDTPESVFISKRFRKKGVWTMGSTDDVVELPLWNGEPNQEWKKCDDKTERIVIHLKHKVSGYDYYGLPSNVASLPQQILEYKGARFNLDMFDNNMVVGGVVFLQGDLTDEESKKMSRKINEAHTGDGNRGKYVLLSSQDGAGNSKVQDFNTSKDFDYVEGDKRLEEKIIFANEWSKALIDPNSAGLGSNSGKQIREIYETKMNTVIKPEQEFVMDKFIYPLLQEAGKWLGNDFAALKLGIDNIPALGIANEIDVNSVLNVNEGREALGYPEHEDAQLGTKTIKDSTQLKLYTNAPD